MGVGLIGCGLWLVGLIIQPSHGDAGALLKLVGVGFMFYFSFLQMRINDSKKRAMDPNVNRDS